MASITEYVKKNIANKQYSLGIYYMPCFLVCLLTMSTTITYPSLNIDAIIIPKWISFYFGLILALASMAYYSLINKYHFYIQKEYCYSTLTLVTLAIYLQIRGIHLSYSILFFLLYSLFIFLKNKYNTAQLLYDFNKSLIICGIYISGVCEDTKCNSSKGCGWLLLQECNGKCGGI